MGDKPKHKDHIIAFDKYIWVLREEDPDNEEKMNHITQMLSNRFSDTDIEPTTKTKNVINN